MCENCERPVSDVNKESLSYRWIFLYARKRTGTFVLLKILISSIKMIFDIMRTNYSQIIQVTLILFSLLRQPQHLGSFVCKSPQLLAPCHANDTAAYSAGIDFIEGCRTRRVSLLIYCVYMFA